MRHVALALCALTSAAHADGWYFSGSYGGAREPVHCRAAEVRFASALGIRRGHWAVQADAVADLANREPAIASYGLDVKYIEPISRRFEVYARGRAMRAFADTTEPADTARGNGLGVGAGIQAKGKLSLWGMLPLRRFFRPDAPSITCAIYLDTGYDFYRLHDPAQDRALSSLTLGWSVGSDF